MLGLLCCHATYGQSYRNQDAAIGGLAGAVIGGIIGHQSDETPAGALIGGAVGAVTGSWIGDSKDQQVARRRGHRAVGPPEDRAAAGPHALALLHVKARSQDNGEYPQRQPVADAEVPCAPPPLLPLP